MMKISKILSQEEVLKNLEEIKNPIVSIASPGERPMELRNRNNLLELDFHDIDEKILGQVHPNLNHINATLDWAKDKNEIIVHCYMGISRSSALAFGILLQEGYSAKECFNQIMQIRSLAFPNKMIMRILWEKFDLNPQDYSFIYNELTKEKKIIF